MRISLLFLFVGTVLADDAFETTRQALEAAKPETFKPGARAKVVPIVEKLGALKDPRVAGLLADYITFTLEGEVKLGDGVRIVQSRGAEAARRIKAIDRELKHLNIRLKAGAQDVAPRIAQLKAERVTVERAFQQVQAETARYERAVSFGRELREMLIERCASSVRALEGDAAEQALRGIRGAIDLRKEDQALILVRLLRECRHAAAVSHLIEVLQYPNIAKAAQRQAVLALATHDDPRGVKVLVGLWERDPKGVGPHARYALSLVAKRPLKSLEEARAWSAKRPN